MPRLARLAATLALSLLVALPAAGEDNDSAGGRMISGALIYREKVTLPDDALMVVELSTLDGNVVAETSRPTNGAQVPLPFALPGPAMAPVDLRAAVFVGGRAVWSSAPMLVGAGSGRHVVPPVMLSKAEAVAFTDRFACGKTVVDIAFSGGKARMRVDGKSYDLEPRQSASGARYGAVNDDGTWFWGKGNSAMVSLGGTKLPSCRPRIAPSPFPLRAGGTEPGWRIEMDHGRILFTPQEGEKVTAPLPVPDVRLDGLRFALPRAGLDVTVTRKVCHDIATGLPFPLTLAVTRNGKDLHGCGGDPVEVLAGAPWQVVSAGSMDSFPEGAEMSFRGNLVSGRAPCNRFSARLFFGEGMRLGPVAATKMACARPKMEAEQALFNALGATDGFDVVGGELHLLARGKVVLVARH